MGLKKTTSYSQAKQGDTDGILDVIIDNQIQFQKLAGIDIGTKDPEEMQALSEIYLFKAIEEVVELRKCVPSSLNKWAKNQPKVDRQRILDEFSDVFLFMMNFSILWDISPSVLLNHVKYTQTKNFETLKKKLADNNVKEKQKVQYEFKNVGDDEIPF